MYWEFFDKKIPVTYNNKVAVCLFVCLEHFPLQLS